MPPNPYCRLCINLFNTMVEKTDYTPAKLCQQQPLNVQRQCNLVATAMKTSSSVKDLLEGCTDTTGHFNPELQDDAKAVITESNGVRASPCPGIIACNIIEAHSGAPMCGVKLRGWGDYFYEKSVGNPIRPSMLDTFPSDGFDMSENEGSATSINLAPPPYSSFSSLMPIGANDNVSGNGECELCMDTFNAMAIKYPHPSEAAALLETVATALATQSGEPPAKNLLCMHQPISMLAACDRFTPGFTKNVDVTKILVDGCIDKTTNEVLQTEPNGCSAEVACNIIRRTAGGPYCGTRLRTRGDLTAQPANHNWNLRAQPLQ
jgi:hypothetical protein